MLLGSYFLLKEPTLDTPGEAKWEGQDDDDWRGFKYAVVEGTVGTIKLDGHMMYETRIGESHYIFGSSPETVVYNE